MNPESETPEQPTTKKPSSLKSPMHLFVLLVVLVALVVAAIVVGQHKSTKPASTAAKETTTATPTLSLSPSSETVAAGDTVTLAVWEDSGKQEVNAVQADITYPTDNFELATIDSVGSAFDVQAEASVNGGKIVIARGHIGKLTGRQLVAKISLKALAAAKGVKISFVDGTVLVSASSNKDILGQKISGTYTIGVK